MKYKFFSYLSYLLFVSTFLNIEAYSNYYSFSLGSTLTGGLMLSAWVFDTIKYQKFNINKLGLIPLLIFFIYSCLSCFWSIDVDSTLLFLNRFFLCFIFFVVSIDLLNSLERIILSIKLYTISILVLCFGAGINVINNVPFKGTVDRFTVNGIDPNDFGIILLSGILLNIIIILNRRNIYNIIYFLFIFITFCFFILCTSSRAVLFALLLTMLFMLGKVIFKKPIYLFLLIASFISFVPYISKFIPERSLDRLLNQSVLDDGGSGRTDIWSTIIELSDNNFIIGYGLNTLRYLIGWEAHNTFLSVFFGGGLLGLLVWVSIWLSILISIINIKFFSYRYLCLFILIVLLIGNFTLNWEVRKTMYFIFAIIIQLSVVLKKVNRL